MFFRQVNRRSGYGKPLPWKNTITEKQPPPHLSTIPSVYITVQLIL